MTQMAQRWQLLSPWWRCHSSASPGEWQGCPCRVLSLPYSSSFWFYWGRLRVLHSSSHYILAPQTHWQGFLEGQNSQPDWAPNMLEHEQALVWCLCDDWERAGRRLWDSDYSCHWALCFVGDCATSPSWGPYFSHLRNDTDIIWLWVGKAGDKGM